MFVSREHQQCPWKMKWTRDRVCRVELGRAEGNRLHCGSCCDVHWLLERSILQLHGSTHMLMFHQIYSDSEVFSLVSVCCITNRKSSSLFFRCCSLSFPFYEKLRGTTAAWRWSLTPTGKHTFNHLRQETSRTAAGPNSRHQSDQNMKSFPLESEQEVTEYYSRIITTVLYIHISLPTAGWTLPAGRHADHKSAAVSVHLKVFHIPRLKKFETFNQY